MDDQIILVSDENGNFTGEYLPKEVGHSGEGKRHLAITVLVYNNRDQVLLQRRKHRVFDDIWDITGATHPLHLQDRDETLEEATERCLKREYDIEGVILRNLGSFNYFANYGDLCENEHCYLLVGEYNGLVKLNLEVGYEHKWMKKDEFIQDIEDYPQNYSPWAVEAVKILQETGFFN